MEASDSAKRSYKVLLLFSELTLLGTVVLNSSFDIFSNSNRVSYSNNSYHFTWHLERPNYSINRHYNDLFASGPFLIALRGPLSVVEELILLCLNT